MTGLPVKTTEPQKPHRGGRLQPNSLALRKQGQEPKESLPRRSKDLEEKTLESIRLESLGVLRVLEMSIRAISAIFYA